MQKLILFSRTNMFGLAWGLTIIADGLALLAWGQNINWQFGHLSPYLIFPLLGLIAFSTMWSQYMAGMARRLLDVEKVEPGALLPYSEATGYIVTTSILLHPSLLIYQLHHDGFGLPPDSYSHYIAAGKKWAIMLGSLSFFVFLAFELRRKYRDRFWWKYVNYANDVAIVAIFVHSLTLGTNTAMAWFHYVWIFYGLTLTAALLHKYIPRLSQYHLAAVRS